MHSLTIVIDGPIFERGNVVALVQKVSKSADEQRKLDALLRADRLEVIGTRIVKRFSGLFDHENDEYIQMVWFNVNYDGQPISLSSSHVELIGFSFPQKHA